MLFLGVKAGFFIHLFWLSFQVCLAINNVHPIRNTNYGKVRGIVTDVPHAHGQKRIEKFFGIPYARPPVGALRLEVPQPPISWGVKIRDATVLPPACPQPAEGVAYIEYHVPGFNRTSEDCLYLNIYTSKSHHHHKKLMPVLVFIHGGSYQNGMGAMFDGSVMATHGVVVVTLNYRLGPLGFLTAGDDNIPGNYGMLDMVQALKWVKHNIVHFHGDPGRVTIDGHSAGGCSVGLLLMSPLAKGLFHHVIQQSGSPLALWSVERYNRSRPAFLYNIFTSTFKCNHNDSAEVKRCLQNQDSRKIEAVIFDDYEWSTSLTPQYKPIVDGYFLPSAPENIVYSGDLNAKSFMTGATKDEGLFAAIPLVKHFKDNGPFKTGARMLMSLMNCFRGDLPEIPGIVDAVLDEYVDRNNYDLSEENIQNSFAEIVGDYFITAPTHLIASALSKQNISVYVYNYEYKSMLDQWEGVIHGAELFYLSGCPFTGHTNFRYDESDKKMSRLLLLLWTNFVKYGVPSLEPKEKSYIPLYTTNSELYSKIFSNDQEPTVAIESHLKPSRMIFWNQKVPEMYARQTDSHVPFINNKNYNVSKTYTTYTAGTNTWILIAVCIGLSVLTLCLAVGYYRTRKEVSTLMRQSLVHENGCLNKPLTNNVKV